MKITIIHIDVPHVQDITKDGSSTTVVLDWINRFRILFTGIIGIQLHKDKNI